MLCTRPRTGHSHNLNHRSLVTDAETDYQARVLDYAVAESYTKGRRYLHAWVQSQAEAETRHYMNRLY